MKCMHMYVGTYPLAQTYWSEDNFGRFPPSAVGSNAGVELKTIRAWWALLLAESSLQPQFIYIT